METQRAILLCARHRRPTSSRECRRGHIVCGNPRRRSLHREGAGKATPRDHRNGGSSTTSSTGATVTTMTLSSSSLLTPAWRKKLKKKPPSGTEKPKSKAIVVKVIVAGGQSWHKKWSQLRVHESNITFHIKIRFSYFIKLGFENQIFSKWPHQNTSFPWINTC